MNIFGESLQDVADETATRNILLCHGPTIVEFSLAYLRRDEEGKLRPNPDNPVTAEAARQYSAAFLGVANTLELQTKIADSTGLSWLEVGQYAIVLEAMAEPAEA